MRFWISWYQAAEDYRPVIWPLPPSIPAYWCTGRDSDGDATLCAIVDAPSERHAYDAIRAAWKGGIREWRGCEARTNDWRPPSDRFPWPKWAEPGKDRTDG